ncbi:MAG: 3-deoxy-D-manno-octulosonic acid transferase, partial [Leptothrix sp. (in: Bacteria)]|nr:3-deoxy-D-manno-octulosonic acid transferase [Leptothrix sp. (in: b-proteobacteria)]
MMGRWAETLARWSYGLLMRLLLPLLLLRLLWRAHREPLYGRWLGERLGLGAASNPGAIWIHAVSLGETRAAEPLILRLRELRPGVPLLLTHGTATGREAGQGLLAAGDAQRWLPLDTPGATQRFFRRHRPAVGVLMETEVWPALLFAAAEAGVPMVLANARLSARSLRKSLRFDRLLRPAARRLALVLAQTADDAQRLAA